MPPRSKQPLEAPPKNDAYVGMLTIAMAAMILGIVLLAIDWNSFGEQKPQEPPAPVTVKAMQQKAGNQPAPPQPAPPQPKDKEMPKAKEKEKEKAKEKAKAG